MLCATATSGSKTTILRCSPYAHKYLILLSLSVLQFDMSVLRNSNELKMSVDHCHC